MKIKAVKKFNAPKPGLFPLAFVFNRLRLRNTTRLGGVLILLAFFTASNWSRGQAIQLSVAMPVTNQTVTITVPGLGDGGIINITDSHNVTTQLLANAASQAMWTPSRYGKYLINSGMATQTMWVTARPMTFHWWNCTTNQTNVTVVMQSDPAWQARGVTSVDWTGGEAYSRGVDGHYWTNAVDWYNGWSYAYAAGGMAIDEAYFDAGFPTDPILQAISMVRQAEGTNYSISLWSDGVGYNFAAGAALLKSNNVTVLIEDYYGTWSLHSSRWAAIESYGLQNQAISGIWPGTAPLTNAAAVRADMALVRLAAPFANGIAIFAPETNNYTPANLAVELSDCDQAIEDYFLKPLIYLSLDSGTQLLIWNLGNDDATGFSLRFLNGSGGVITNIDLSDLAADGQRLVSIPNGAVNAQVVNPPGTANLYTGNSQYSNGLYPMSVPGRYTWNNANGDHLWSTFSNWNPQGPPPGNIDSGNYAYFDGSAATPGSVTAAAGETSINSVQFVTGGWTISGSATAQDFYTYGIFSSGAGTNTINIGVSARDVVPAYCVVGESNTLIMNGQIGAVRNNGGLIKLGAGTIILAGPNAYTGATTLNSGTLLVNSSLTASSTVTVGGGATLGGTGTINGSVTNNGTISPGAGVGTLATGAETWNGGGGYLCEINATNPTGSDRLNISGALTVAATTGNPFTVQIASLTTNNTRGLLANFDPSRNYTWTIATAASLSGFSPAKFTVNTSQFSNTFIGAFVVTNSGNSVVLNYVAPAVPPEFTGVALLSGNLFQASFTGRVGQAFSVRATNNLLAPVLTWPVLSSGTIGGSGAAIVTDPISSTNAQKFYRISSP